MSIKLNKEQVGKIVVGTGKAVVFGLSCLALVIPHVENSISAVKRLTAKADYGGAIKAIMNSDMMSSYKQDAVEAVLKGQDEAYYESIIEVINSNMLSSYKIDAIKKINE
jgi:hypothetical protein